MYEELYTQNRLSSFALRNCGFEEAPNSSLPYQLYRAEHTQHASCLRDTLVLAMQNYHKLQNILLQAGTIKQWKFFHIILCSIPDKVSKIKRKETIEEIIRLNSLWQTAAFKTFFIPIGMGDDDIQEIMRLCEFGGPDWMYYPTTYSDFHEQFKSVMYEIGIAGKDSLLASSHEDVYVPEPIRSSFAVTLSIEASQLMKGEKWESLVNTISFYMRNLGPKNILSGIIFSSRPWVVGMINHEQANEQLRPLVQQEQINHQEQGNRNRPHYQEYAQPVRRGNRGRNCGYCITVIFILFFIRLIIYIAVS